MISVFFLLLAPHTVFALTPNDPQYTHSQPFLEQIGVPDVWDKTTGSREIIIAVLDSGVDINHPDLRQNIWHNTAERPNGIDDDGNGYIDDFDGWDFVSDDNGVGPDTGNEFSATGIHHGTVVAGLIGAVGNNGTDSTGVAMKSSIMSLKVMDNHGLGEVAHVIKAIQYAVDNGADIINLSFSGPESSEALKQAMRKAHAAGVIVVVAAGNDNDDADSGNLDFHPKFPVCTDNNSSINAVVGVGAVDSEDVLTDFSNYGSCLDLVAPGDSIVSTLNHEPSRNKFNETFGGYFSGTSLAAPLVSGTAALLMSLHSTWTHEDIVVAMYESADPIDFKNTDKIGKLGRGRLNAAKAANVQFTEIILTPPRQPAKPMGVLVVGPATDGFGEIRLIDVNEGFLDSFQPFGAIDSGLTFVVDDLENDGDPEIIVGHNKTMHIFNMKGDTLRTIPLRSQLNTKISIATGDLQGNGDKEIIVAHEKGSQTVWLYTKEGYDLGQFEGGDEPLDGIRVATGDVTNDEAAEIIVAAAGSSKDADVWVHLSDGNLYTAFQAFTNVDAIIHSQGVALSAADLNNDGTVEVVAGAYAGNSLVRSFTFIGALVGEFMAYDHEFTGGVRLSSGDLESDGHEEIIVSAGPGGGPHVKMVDEFGNLKDEWFVFDNSFRGGIVTHFTK